MSHPEIERRRAELAERRRQYEARQAAEARAEHPLPSAPRLAMNAARSSEPPLPSAPRLALNAAQAAARVATAKLADPTRSVLAPPDVLAARLAVCREGEGLSPDQMAGGHCGAYRPSDDRCGAAGCGCFLARTPKGLPGRAAYLSLKCPLGRWPA